MLIHKTRFVKILKVHYGFPWQVTFVLSRGKSENLSVLRYIQDMILSENLIISSYFYQLYRPGVLKHFKQGAGSLSLRLLGAGQLGSLVGKDLGVLINGADGSWT